jgi:hypothetical protein
MQEADHLSLFRKEVKNAWFFNTSPAHLLILHVDWVNSVASLPIPSVPVTIFTLRIRVNPGEELSGRSYRTRRICKKTESSCEILSY